MSQPETLKALNAACPTCGQPFPFPEEPTLRYERKLSHDRWEVSYQLGPWRGWAIQRTPELAHKKALARLHYAKQHLTPGQGV